MKKILLGLLFCTLGLFSRAQSSVVSMTGSGATITNTATVSCSTNVQNTHDNVSVQVTVTKTSGTIAGSAILFGSVDGINYNAIGVDTLTLTNVTTNTKIWAFTNANYFYYKVSVTGSGTMAGTVIAKLYGSSAILKHAVTTMRSSYNLTSDTATNSGTTYVGITTTNSYSTVTIQAVVTKISGTVAGTVTLQGSDDGTNYVTVSSSFATSTTHTATNVATSTKHFIITGNPYKYYRLSYTGSGTMSAILKGYLMPNKK